jgi:hypothetical protein
MNCVRRMKNFWMLELVVPTLTARPLKVSLLFRVRSEKSIEGQGYIKIF